MDNKEKKEIQKYRTLYMSLGMCFGVSLGLVYGMLFFPDNSTMGMCFGLPVGMTIGICVGTAKDKRLSEKMMEVTRIVDVQETKGKLIYAMDKEGNEKEFKVTEKKMKEEKFSVGDRVAEEQEGVLVSLETK